MLAIDAGNTNTRFAVLANGSVKRKKSLPTRTLDREQAIEAISELGANDTDRRVWIASVAPGASEILSSALESIDLKARFIRPQTDHVISNRLDTPGTTGADRLLAALAGAAYFPEGKGYLVIQCGSAVTVDLVEHGVFQGGFILPGPEFWLRGLAEAALLPDLSKEIFPWEETNPGISTREALLRGMTAGLPGAIDRSAQLLGGGNPHSAVITGGWGTFMAGKLAFPAVYDADLVLNGIGLFATNGFLEKINPLQFKDLDRSATFSAIRRPNCKTSIKNRIIRVDK